MFATLGSTDCVTRCYWMRWLMVKYPRSLCLQGQTLVWAMCVAVRTCHTHTHTHTHTGKLHVCMTVPGKGQYQGLYVGSSGILMVSFPWCRAVWQVPFFSSSVVGSHETGWRCAVKEMPHPQYMFHHLEDLEESRPDADFLWNPCRPVADKWTGSLSLINTLFEIQINVIVNFVRPTFELLAL